MMDKIFEFSLNTDWLSPMLSMWGDFWNGSRADFAIDWDCGWSVNEVGALLEQHSIDYWGLMARNSKILFSTKKEGSDDTIEILELNGIVEYEEEE